MATRFIILAAFLFFSASAIAQTTSPETMLCREWMLAGFETNGVYEAPDANSKDDRLTFFKDGKMVLLEDGERVPGIWSYDASTKMLLLSDVESEDVIQVEVIKLNDAELVTRMVDDTDVFITYFKPARK